MLTIIFDGKTYKPKGTFYSIETILDWIKCGDLEEVKENKEPTVHIPNDGNKYMINGELYNPQANSILEKLREELERRIENARIAINSGEHIPEYDCLEEMLFFLTSLETKEEPTYMESMGWKATPEGNIIVPQFTPGQMIEVSNDGEKWEEEPREFVGMENGEYMTNEAGRFIQHWKYARQPQEDIELPEFNWDWVMKQLEENQKLNLIPFTALAVMATHIGAMDKIIQANKK